MSSLQRIEPSYVDPNGRQVGGTHYSGSAYQHWDYATDLHMRHLEGAATKYLARAGNKVGESRTKDLEKVQHYLEKLLDMYKNRRIISLRDAQGSSFLPEPVVAKFIALSVKYQAFTPRCVAVLILISRWTDANDLSMALGLVSEELEEEREKPAMAAESRLG